MCQKGRCSVAKQGKTTEAKVILRQLSPSQLGALHAVRGSKEFKELIGIVNGIIQVDKDKQVGLVSDVSSADDAIKQASKQNFYRGRVSALVLLHSLMVGAEQEISRRGD